MGQFRSYLVTMNARERACSFGASAGIIANAWSALLAPSGDLPYPLTTMFTCVCWLFWIARAARERQVADDQAQMLSDLNDAISAHADLTDKAQKRVQTMMRAVDALAGYQVPNVLLSLKVTRGSAVNSTRPTVMERAIEN